jgi:hypothetical protein
VHLLHVMLLLILALLLLMLNPKNILQRMVPRLKILATRILLLKGPAESTAFHCQLLTAYCCVTQSSLFLSSRSKFILHASN